MPESLTITDPSTLVRRFGESLTTVFNRRADLDELEGHRGLPPYVLRDVMAAHPLSAYVPNKFGGFGDDIWVGQAILEEASYHSLSLGLMMGINGGLFVQPVGKYADPATAKPILSRFLSTAAMGGLSITEPGHGTDALAMRTNWTKTDSGYRITGVKHWAGLTGVADYWLVMARPQLEDGSLGNGIDLFICDQNDPAQYLTVIERYPALGLYAIPYGRTEIDVQVPAENRLDGGRGGLRMMMDLLHRSRIQFPGMAVGFIRRLLDEAQEHCATRSVSGSPLVEYDQVRARIARMHGQWVVVNALGLWAAENASVANDLSRQAVPANAIKTVSTDYMQEAAQSLLQLVGAKGWLLAHIAGRAIVDSRPFQIFEGSNDVLYIQVGSKISEDMRRAGITNLREYVEQEPTLAAAAALVPGTTLDIEVDPRTRQRNLTQLGAIVSRLFALAQVSRLADRGFDADSIETAVRTVTADINSSALALTVPGSPEIPDFQVHPHAWSSFQAR